MRKWWKDTNDPSGSFHSVVPVIQFQFLPQLKGKPNFWQFHTENIPRSVPAECSQGTAVALPQLCPPHHTKLRVTNKRTSPRHCCGPAGALWVPGELGILRWKTTCKWFWASLWKVRLEDFCVWAVTRSGGSLSSQPCQAEGQRFPRITGLEVALAPQEFSWRLTASVANCTEKEVAQLSQSSFESGVQRMGHSDNPLLSGAELQLSFILHGSLGQFILPGTSQSSPGVWDTPLRTCSWCWSCPIPAAPSTSLALLYPLPLCVLVTRSQHSFRDDTLVRNDTFVNKSVWWWRRKENIFSSFCFLPRQGSSLCLHPLA